MLPVPAVIYLFYPHGSKNISDLTNLRNYPKFYTLYNIPIIAHDQEPLNYDYYENIDPLSINHIGLSKFSSILITKRKQLLVNKNLMLATHGLESLYDQVILLHSEKNSNQLEKYSKADFVPVYYWCHAVISRDWYRFAEFDPRLQSNSNIQKKFLIYNRAWGNTREYRLKFLELLIEHNLHTQSQTSMARLSEGDGGYHYQDHKFKNTDFKLNNNTILDLLQDNHCDSNESARYNPDDYNSTGLSVVLETVFDDSRIHLTEKTLRPIACGHPFLLAAGPGSLEYLRSYGFQTFAPWIDETYDQEINSVKRLQKIINSMKKINDLSPANFDQFLIETKRIAEFNKTHFFSDAFEQQITTELKDNLINAVGALKKPRGRLWRSSKKILKNEIAGYRKIRHDIDRDVVRWLRAQSKLS